MREMAPPVSDFSIKHDGTYYHISAQFSAQGTNPLGLYVDAKGIESEIREMTLMILASQPVHHDEPHPEAMIFAYRAGERA